MTSAPLVVEAWQNALLAVDCWRRAHAVRRGLRAMPACAAHAHLAFEQLTLGHGTRVLSPLDPHLLSACGTASLLVPSCPPARCAAHPASRLRGDDRVPKAMVHVHAMRSLCCWRRRQTAAEEGESTEQSRITKQITFILHRLRLRSIPDSHGVQPLSDVAAAAAGPLRKAAQAAGLEVPCIVRSRKVGGSL